MVIKPKIIIRQKNNGIQMAAGKHQIHCKTSTVFCCPPYQWAPESGRLSTDSFGPEQGRMSVSIQSHHNLNKIKFNE